MYVYLELYDLLEANTSSSFYRFNTFIKLERHRLISIPYNNTICKRNCGHINKRYQMEELTQKIKSFEIADADAKLFEEKSGHVTRTDKRQRDSEFIKELHEKDSRERYYANAMRNMKLRAQFYRSSSQGKFCDTCWLMDYSCVCEKNIPVETHHRYITLMHFKGKGVLIILLTV